MNRTTLARSASDLDTFLEVLPEGSRLSARTAIHAWEGGGGAIKPGRHAVRLLVPGDDPVTAGTVHAPHGAHTAPFLELCRIILRGHGFDDDRWTHWSDGLAELQPLGLDPSLKFPTLPLDDRISAAELAALVNGLRDLARELAPGAGRAT